MTTKGRKHHKEPWRDVLDEFIEDPGKSNGKPKAAGDLASIDDTLESLRTTPAIDRLDKVVDYDDRGRKYDVDQAPMVPGDAGDDSPTYAQLKPKRVGSSDTDKRFDADKVDPNTFSTDGPVQLKPSVIGNPAAQMIAAGHGFMVDDRRSRPWKSAPRTHCAHCGGEMPPADVSKYPCEFDADGWSPFAGCRCSGCTLRELVSKGHERNKGQPRKYCSSECRRLADNERRRWERAVARAAKLGLEPPAPPEDKGLKFLPARGLRSSVEGHGHRYVSADA